MTTNRRIHERVPVGESSASLVVRYESKDAGVIQANARDISKGGVMVMHEKPVKVGTPCTVEIRKEGAETSLKAEIVHCHRIGVPLYRIGIRFSDELSEQAFRSLATASGEAG